MERIQNIRVIVVEPEYQINLGHIARVMKNFGVLDLRLVNPRCNPRGADAVKYSKHAVGLLRSAKIQKSIKEAARGCDMIVGTTAVWHKTEGSFFNIYDLESAKKLVSKANSIGIVLGREGTGLSKDELAECGAAIYIDTDSDYGTMNVSHALAVLLYVFRTSRKTALPEQIYAGAKEKAGLVALFRNEVGGRQNIRNKGAVVAAFQHILDRSYPTKKELSAIAVALSPKFRKKKRKSR